MDIRILRYFLAVAREGNITNAANSLHIAQPSLSKQLIDLENELGKTLLIRGKRKITLTEDGILLRKRASEIVSLLDKTTQEITADSGCLNGEVAIGGNTAITVLKSAASLHKQYPDIQFHFYCSDAIDISERLDHGSLDFAVMLEPIDTSKYEYISLPDTSYWGLVLPIEDPLSAKNFIEKEDLLPLPLVLHRRVGLQHSIASWCEVAADDLNIAATYNIINGTPEYLAKSGIGYLLTTRDHLSEKLDNNICFRPLHPILKTQYAIVWKRHPVFSKTAEAFLREIKTVAANTNNLFHS